MTIFSKNEIKSKIQKWEAIAQGRLEQRIANKKVRSVSELDVELNEARINAASPEELSDVKKCLASLCEKLAYIEGRLNPETEILVEPEERDSLKDRIEEIEAAIEIYGSRN